MRHSRRPIAFEQIMPFPATSNHSRCEGATGRALGPASRAALTLRGLWILVTALRGACFKSLQFTPDAFASQINLNNLLRLPGDRLRAVRTACKKKQEDGSVCHAPSDHRAARNAQSLRILRRASEEGRIMSAENLL